MRIDIRDDEDQQDKEVQFASESDSGSILCYLNDSDRFSLLDTDDCATYCVKLRDIPNLILALQKLRDLTK